MNKNKLVPSGERFDYVCYSVSNIVLKRIFREHYFFSLWFALLSITCIYSCAKTDTQRTSNNYTDTTFNNTDSTFHVNISGVIKNCSNTNLTNGDLIIVCNQGYLFMHITNGIFDTTLIAGNSIDSISLWAIDLDSLTVSDTIRMHVSSDSISIGTLSACSNNVDEYIKCKINNENFVYVPVLFDTLNAGGFDTLGAPTTYLYRSSQHISNSTFYRMQFAGMSVGTYGVNWNSTFQMGRYYSFNLPGAGTTNYSSYENEGGYIQGTMNIPFVDNTDSLNYTLTGSFRVRRNY